MIQLIIPVTDNTKFFPREDYFFPKPLVEVVDKPMIVEVINHIERAIDIFKIIFVIPEELEIKYSLGSILKISTSSDIHVVTRSGNTSGGLCSSLLALDHIDSSYPLAVMNMDEIYSCNLDKIIQYFNQSADVGIIIFPSTHPRWCYAEIGDNGNVEFVAEKKVISSHALAGFYYFKTKDLFLELSSKAMIEDDKLGDLFYISSSVNQGIINGYKVKFASIDYSEYFSLYSPTEISRYKDFTTSYGQTSLYNLIIPAAGGGTRFAEAGWKSPKPFIDVNGSIMLDQVLSNLCTRRSRPTLLLQEKCINEHQLQIQALDKYQVNVVKVCGLTEGTMCTILHAKDTIDQKIPVMIANSDQIIDFDISLFYQDFIDRGLDGSILVFDEQNKDPKWSYAMINDQGMVTKVAEKNPISNFATVGIYLFKSFEMLKDAAIDMVISNSRTNGEFYTCPVYNFIINRGYKVGIFEIKPEQMHGIGTPTDLNQYLHIKKLPKSQDEP